MNISEITSSDLLTDEKYFDEHALGVIVLNARHATAIPFRLVRGTDSPSRQKLKNSIHSSSWGFDDDTSEFLNAYVERIRETKARESHWSWGQLAQHVSVDIIAVGDAEKSNVSKPVGVLPPKSFFSVFNVGIASILPESESQDLSWQALQGFLKRSSRGGRRQERDSVMWALGDPRWDFRTIDGLSRETGLPSDKVVGVLNDNKEAIRSPLFRDRSGRALYTLASRRTKFREILAVVFFLLGSRRSG